MGQILSRTEFCVEMHDVEGAFDKEWARIHDHDKALRDRVREQAERIVELEEQKQAVERVCDHHAELSTTWGIKYNALVEAAQNVCNADTFDRLRFIDALSKLVDEGGGEHTTKKCPVCHNLPGPRCPACGSGEDYDGRP